MSLFRRLAFCGLVLMIGLPAGAVFALQQGRQFVVTWQGQEYLVAWTSTTNDAGSQALPDDDPLNLGLDLSHIDDLTLQRRPSISPETIDRVLAEYKSPAQGTGKAWFELGLRYGIDPAYALAFFVHESTAGTNPDWVGMKPDGSTTHNIGNIICAGYATCYKGFRNYSDWQTGIDDWYRLVDREYIRGRGLTTIEQITPIYCPASDGCNPSSYVNITRQRIVSWRQEEQRAYVDRQRNVLVMQSKIADPTRPSGCPLAGGQVILTQGYGVGSHAPVAIWGGVDLALGAGAHADPGLTANAPIYAISDGTARVRLDTWPGGNYLAIENDRYKVAYAHLSRFLVLDGQTVARGQVIGFVGSTGQTSGPHLHLEVWEQVNKNPLDYIACGG